MIYLNEDLKKYFAAGSPLFEQLMAMQGERFREQKGRVTQRVMIGEKSYFIKQHRGVGWQEIFKNLIQWRLPIISAKNEWLAIAKLKSLGISAPKVVGYGERGKNPATRESFILMEEITPAISLEDLSHQWQNSPPDFKQKRQIIESVATIARMLHQHGMNHRDFYICHFLMNPAIKRIDSHDLYLIDLHRASIRTKTPMRWIMKDLAALLFSCQHIALTKRDYYRFMKIYSGQSLRAIFLNHLAFWQKVQRRGTAYRDHTQP